VSDAVSHFVTLVLQRWEEHLFLGTFAFLFVLWLVIGWIRGQ
jgi:hypothetical protein